MAQNAVSHPGTVVQATPDNVMVMIMAESACASCHSKKLCTLSEMKEKTISIPVRNQSFAPGDAVDVIMTESLGMLAIFLAYILPFLLLVASVVAGNAAGLSEPATGIMVVGLLTVYFFILYFMRKRLQKKFSFKLIKK